MTWEDDLAAVELQLSAGVRARWAGEVDERRAAELRGLRLIDRLTPHIGRAVTMGVTGHPPVAGLVEAVGPDWVLLTSGPVETFVALAHLGWVDGIGPRSEVVVGSRASAALDLRHVVTMIARDRSPVWLTTTDGVEHHGTVDAVGTDHVVLARHEPGEARRAGSVRGVRTLVLAAVVAVRRFG